MTTSGMLLADLPEGSRLAYGESGQHKVKGNAAVGQVRLTHLKSVRGEGDRTVLIYE